MTKYITKKKREPLKSKLKKISKAIDDDNLENILIQDTKKIINDIIKTKTKTKTKTKVETGTKEIEVERTKGTTEEIGVDKETTGTTGTTGTKGTKDETEIGVEDTGVGTKEIRTGTTKGTTKEIGVETKKGIRTTKKETTKKETTKKETTKKKSATKINKNNPFSAFASAPDPDSIKLDCLSPSTACSSDEVDGDFQETGSAPEKAKAKVKTLAEEDFPETEFSQEKGETGVLDADLEETEFSQAEDGVQDGDSQVTNYSCDDRLDLGFEELDEGLVETEFSQEEYLEIQKIQKPDEGLVETEFSQEKEETEVETERLSLPQQLFPSMKPPEGSLLNLETKADGYGETKKFVRPTNKFHRLIKETIGPMSEVFSKDGGPLEPILEILTLKDESREQLHNLVRMYNAEWCAEYNGMTIERYLKEIKGLSEQQVKDIFFVMPKWKWLERQKQFTDEIIRRLSASSLNRVIGEYDSDIRVVHKVKARVEGLLDEGIEATDGGTVKLDRDGNPIMRPLKPSDLKGLAQALETCQKVSDRALGISDGNREIILKKARDDKEKETQKTEEVSKIELLTYDDCSAIIAEYRKAKKKNPKAVETEVEIVEE